jgi:hypothetical protein
MGAVYLNCSFDSPVMLTPCGNGSNTSTVSLPVLSDDEEGTQCRGGDWANVFLGDVNSSTSPSRYGGESQI